MICFQKGSFSNIALLFCAATFVVSGCTGEPTDGGTDPSPTPSVNTNDDAGIVSIDGGQNADADGGAILVTDAGVPGGGPTQDAGYYDAGPRTECPTEGCDDNNPCTNDFCSAETNFFCTNAPKTNGTICTNVCQPQAVCQEGVCEGERISGINDYNPCTEDSCDPSILAGSPILHAPLEGATCPTTNQCRESGICVCDENDPDCEAIRCDSEAGEIRNCDDGNACTVDLCDPTAGGCQDSQILATNECRPIIQIDYPPRGATISGSASNQLIPLLGSITSNLGDIVSATANGLPLFLDDDGNLPVNQSGLASNWIPVDVGINVLIIEARDSRDQVHRQVQSFLWANRYTPPDPTGAAPNLADDTMGIYLGGPSLDDGDHSLPPNDIATLFELGLATDFNLGALLGNVQEISFSYDGTSFPDVFDTANVTHLPVRVSLTPVAPFGMHLTMTLSQIEIPLNLPSSLGFSTSPVVTYETILFDADLVVITGENGQVDVTPANVTVSLGEASANTGIVDADTSLENILSVGSGYLATSFQLGFSTVLTNDIAPVIGNMFSAFNFEQTLFLPSLETDAEPIEITMISTVFEETFTDNGGLFRMRGGASALAIPSIISNSHGVPEVSSCDGTTSTLTTPELAPIELLITDTLLNQIFYAAWSAGLLEFQVDSTAVFSDIDDVGISNIEVAVKGLAPPTATSCTPDGELLFHIGDMRIEMKFDLNGLPVNATAHTSFTTELFLTPTADNSAILIELGALKSPSLALEDPINTDIAIQEDDQIDIGPIVINLINENLVDSLLDGLAGGFGTIPLPQFDITGVAEGSSMSLVQQAGDNSVYHFGNSSVVNAEFVGQ